MKRYGLILAVAWLMSGSVARAGELDSEFGGRAPAAVPQAPSVAKASSELDSESPTQTCCIKRWFCGYPRYYGYYGYGGFGCRPIYCGIGYGGYGGFGYGGSGYGGFGGGFGYGGFGGYGGMYW